MPEIMANGTQFEYIEQGQGEPVILVHGALGDYRTSPLQVESFAKRYRVFAYSRRYHYPNPWVGDGQDYSPLLHAEDLAALITSLGLGRSATAISITAVLSNACVRGHSLFERWPPANQRNS